MISARPRALIAITAILVVLALAISALRSDKRSIPAKPRLMLLTSLPLLFSEDFSIEGGGSPALKALSEAYRVVPVSTTSAAELNKGRLLLMAHPPAQTAENLVVLDNWVRRGGRVMVLADPFLEWPSRHPIGDPLRPSPMFMDTGLLAHWGLRLDAPETRGEVVRKLGGYDIDTVSPGMLAGRCAITADALVARCRIGRGAATIVADADFLNVSALGPKSAHNLDALIAELSSMRQR